MIRLLNKGTTSRHQHRQLLDRYNEYKNIRKQQLVQPFFYQHFMSFTANLKKKVNKFAVLILSTHIQENILENTLVYDW